MDIQYQRSRCNYKEKPTIGIQHTMIADEIRLPFDLFNDKIRELVVNQTYNTHPEFDHLFINDFVTSWYLLTLLGTIYFLLSLFQPCHGVIFKLDKK